MTYSAKYKFLGSGQFFYHMSTMQSKEDCQINEPRTTFSMGVDTALQFPLVRSMCILFTGYFNGVGVEVRSVEAMTLLHHMGCYGKGTTSRSRPKADCNEDSPSIMRRRQFLKRNYWYKRFGDKEKAADSDSFFKDVEDLILKIQHDTKKQSKDVIDLISSDDDNDDGEASQTLESQATADVPNKQNIVVIVPNSDSEDDDYFANLKPKCCLNKVLLHEKLMLTLEEAFFLLCGLGCLKVMKDNNQILNVEECWSLFCNTDRHFVDKYIVYHHFRSKGYIVKSGIKFGGDYLLYKGGPEVNHADYIVVIKFKNETFDWFSLLGHVRMATTVVKDVMVAEVNSQGDNIKLPQEMSRYSVRELVLSRKLPVINNGID